MSSKLTINYHISNSNKALIIGEPIMKWFNIDSKKIKADIEEWIKENPDISKTRETKWVGPPSGVIPIPRSPDEWQCNE